MIIFSVVALVSLILNSINVVASQGNYLGKILGKQAKRLETLERTVQQQSVLIKKQSELIGINSVLIDELSS